MASVIVGLGDTSDAVHAFRWTAAEGMSDLGLLPGATLSEAFAVSADGTVVVGISGSTGSYRAFRWTDAGGMQDLGRLASDSVSYATGANSDGSVIVGTSGSDRVLNSGSRLLCMDRW